MTELAKRQGGTADEITDLAKPSSVGSVSLIFANLEYLGLIALAIAAAVALSLPVLLLPLAPAADGVNANKVYYVCYCGIFSTLWAVTNWDRLSFLFNENTEWADFKHSGILAGSGGLKGNYCFAIATAWIAFSATFSLLGLFWGPEMESSYVLFYGAPVAFVFVDTAWFFCVAPRKTRSINCFACVCALNVLLCAPVLLLFIPSFTDELLQELLGDRVGQGWLFLHDLSVPTLIDVAFATCLAKTLPDVRLTLLI